MLNAINDTYVILLFNVIVDNGKYASNLLLLTIVLAPFLFMVNVVGNNKIYLHSFIKCT